ncbi:late embryogenesis abundant protein, group 3-like [Miscanthus floridulus]|uniref:late embryogenesis abundant protein, group 3-like n=1 Tax=Miscanthus floridulus TaxID=154761 RepID=UPI00345A0FFE
MAEAQATLQRGATSVRADPKEPATQGGAAEAAPTQAGEGAPPPHDGEARGLDGAEVPFAAEATEIEVLGVSQARAMEAAAPRTARATAVVAGAPTTTEATIAEAGAPETIEATMAKPKAPRTTEATMCNTELGREASRAAEASRVEAQRLKEKAEASRVKAQRWKEKSEASQVEARRWGQKAEELEKEVTQATEASAVVQAVLETEIGEHDVLKSAARTTCEALEVEGAISDGYVLPDDDEEADEVVAKLIEVAEGPGTVLAKLFEEEVVPPPPSADAGGPEP